MDGWDEDWAKLAGIGKSRAPSAAVLEGRITAAADADPKSENYSTLLWDAASAADWLGRHQTALRCINEFLRIQPENNEARYERGLQLLMAGNAGVGWKEYRRLYLTPKQIQKAGGLPPSWNGQAAGDGILVFSDQGEGDAIMALRYAPRLKERFNRVLFNCSHSLVDLAKTMPCFEAVIPFNGFAQSEYGSIAGLQCQFHVPVMALPAFFGAFDPDPPPPPPYFDVTAELVAFLREHFGGKGAFRVGLSWKGGPGTPRDPVRSFDIAEFQPLMAIHGVEFFSLQWETEGGETDDLPVAVKDMYREAKAWPQSHGKPWTFLETVALAATMDLVVTCDSVIAHVAGAMDVPTWVALPVASEWRWGVKTARSGWYPKARLFRQRKYDEWKPVFDDMAAELAQLV
jgi:tetratricopeptide (TPR) repeat protein